MKKICLWAAKWTPLDREYHDNEWWVPVYDDKIFFEFLVLEWAQAGLSWSTILKKRNAYREAFFDYDLDKIIEIDYDYFDELMNNDKIVKNKLKIKSVIKNANACKGIIEEFGSLSDYFWSFVEGDVIKNEFEKLTDIPSETDISKAMSKDLKKRWCSFVWPTIMYAFMQATGLVNDHEVWCYRYDEV